MGGSFKIGRFSGIDVRVHWTFLLLLAFFAFIGYQVSGSLAAALTATAVIVALFVCVLLHEFGHSLVAQRLGIDIHSITLLPIGGVSNLESLPEKPSDEFKITVAGPLVNVVLAPIFFGVGLLFGAVPSIPSDLFTGVGSVGQFFFYLGYLNVVLAVFNLLPAFPLDGGRILRGLLATRLGAVRATEIASRVGQLFALAFFLIGLLGGNFLLALVGVFIFFGASGEAQMVRQQELTRGLVVSVRCCAQVPVVPIVASKPEHATWGEEQRMLYGDRGYCIAHAHSRTKEALGRASRSGAGEDQGKEEGSDAPERLGVGSSGRGVSAVRRRRLRRAP